MALTPILGTRACQSLLYTLADATAASNVLGRSCQPPTGQHLHAWRTSNPPTPPHCRSLSATSAPQSSVSGDGFGALPPLPTRRVVVTGLGLVTPLGVGVDVTWRRLLAGESGLRQLREEDLPEAQRPALASLTCRVAGLVPSDQLEEACRRMGLAEEMRRASRFMLLGLVAAEEALADARWPCPALKAGGAGPRPLELALQRTGVVVGNGMSCTTEVAEAGALVAAGRARRVSPFFVPRILPNMAAGAISIRHGFQGPNQAPSTACATGGHAVGDAFRLIQRGEADVMVAGASEACVDAISLTGFSRLKALSTSYNDHPTKASRPFDADRDGFVMGEGAGVLVLEALEHAQRRGADIYAEIRGYGLSGDGHHVTHPHPDGRGAVLCMQRAMAGSGVELGSIAYINAHATSTPTGDAIEQSSILELLSGEPPEGAEPARLKPHAGRVAVAVGSTKGATGHLLGAAGAVEAAFTALALKHRRAPPTLNLERPDPAVLGSLIGPHGPVDLPPSPGLIAALSNSFGFGGTNTCLLLSSMR